MYFNNSKQIRIHVHVHVHVHVHCVYHKILGGINYKELKYSWQQRIPSTSIILQCMLINFVGYVFDVRMIIENVYGTVSSKRALGSIYM